jgi:hypothetical protein
MLEVDAGNVPLPDEFIKKRESALAERELVLVARESALAQKESMILTREATLATLESALESSIVERRWLVYVSDIRIKMVMIYLPFLLCAMMGAATFQKFPGNWIAVTLGIIGIINIFLPNTWIPRWK